MIQVRRTSTARRQKPPTTNTSGLGPLIFSRSGNRGNSLRWSLVRVTQNAGPVDGGLRVTEQATRFWKPLQEGVHYRVTAGVVVNQVDRRVIAPKGVLLLLAEDNSSPNREAESDAMKWRINLQVTVRQWARVPRLRGAVCPSHFRTSNS